MWMLQGRVVANEDQHMFRYCVADGMGVYSTNL